MGSTTNQRGDCIQIPRKYLYVLLILVVTLVGYIIFRQIELSQKIELAQFYKTYVKGYKLDQSWELSKDLLRRQKKIIDRLLIQRGHNSITREQLGRQSWGLLHMITTTVPDQISPQMREQFNAFLLLFTKFYPCKLCANYFMRTLKKVGEFKGQTKIQLMDYMCLIHNRVNKRLGRRIFDCDLVPADWGTCDCYSLNAINSLK